MIMTEVFWDFVFAGIFGVLIGATELMSRYRDEPFEALKTPFSYFYIALNLAASLLALWSLRLFGVTFGLEDNLLLQRWVQVLAAGLGAMMLFRSSVFIFRAGDRDVSVGPSSILEVLLDVLDREVDRARAKKRAKVVQEIMRDIQFQRASLELPIIAFALLQNLSREDQENTHNKIRKLRDSIVSDEAKSNALGLALMDTVGEDVLRVSVEIFKKEIQQQLTDFPSEPVLTPGVVDRALRAKGLLPDEGPGEDGEDGEDSPQEGSSPVEEPDAEADTG